MGFRMSLKFKVVAVSIGSLVVVLLAAFWVARTEFYQLGSNAAVQQARAVMARLEGASRYVAQLNVFEEKTKVVIEKYPDGNVPKHEKQEILLTVPIVAALKLGQVKSEGENFEFRVFADRPRNSENAMRPGDQQIWNKFSKSDLTEIIQESEDGTKWVLYRAVKLKEGIGCLKCHGNPSMSPWKNGKDVLGYDMEDMKDGDLKGVFAFEMSKEKTQMAVANASSGLLQTGLVILVIASVLIFFFIFKPLNFVEAAISGVRRAGRQILENSMDLTLGSEKVAANNMSSMSAITQSSSAMEEVQRMVATTKDASASVKTEATNTESLVRESAKTSRRILEAMEGLKASSSVLENQIEKSATEFMQINTVMQQVSEKLNLIDEIVFQTKLLAFNASVEAARAGEAGKGFAVVAQEIGNLAGLSGQASKEISEIVTESTSHVESVVTENTRRLSDISGSNRTSVDQCLNLVTSSQQAFDRINTSMTSIHDRLETLSLATEEQAAGFQDIRTSLINLHDATNDNQVTADQVRTAAESLKNISKETQSHVLQLFLKMTGSEGCDEGPTASSGAKKPKESALKSSSQAA